jgi:hypothetical protein
MSKPTKSDDFMNGVAVTIVILVVACGALWWLAGLPSS